MDGEQQRDIEVILLRQVASYLATPIFVVDPDGTLVYFNEPAEAILGRRYDEVGEMSHAEWATVFTPTDAHDRPLPQESLPLSVAMRELRSVHGPMRIRGLDGVVRDIAVTAFPIIGQPDRMLGAVALFWEEPAR